MTAGTTPMRTSVKAKVAVSTATATSQAASSPIPPARAGPATRATTGLGAVRIVRRIAGNSATPWRAGAAGLPQVHAGAEDRTGVAQDDHPDGRVGDRRVEVVLQLAAELRGQGVAVAR